MWAHVMYMCTLDDVIISHVGCRHVKRKKKTQVQRRADVKFKRLVHWYELWCQCMCVLVCRIMEECREEWGGGEVTSSDEDTATNQISDEAEVPPISEEEYHRMLRVHHRRRIRKKVSKLSIVGGGREGGEVRSCDVSCVVWREVRSDLYVS